MRFEEALRAALEAENGQENLARKLSMDPSEMSRRLNGQRGWKAAEIDSIIKIGGKVICEAHDIDNLMGTLRLLMREED